MKLPKLVNINNLSNVETSLVNKVASLSFKPIFLPALNDFKLIRFKYPSLDTDTITCSLAINSVSSTFNEETCCSICYLRCRIIVLLISSSSPLITFNNSFSEFSIFSYFSIFLFNSFSSAFNASIS